MCAGDEIKLATWDEYLAMLLSPTGGQTLYRGHREYEWQLESTIERALLEYAGSWRGRAPGAMQSNVVDTETAQWIDRVERDLTKFREI